MKETDIAYIAGLVDGEAYIGIKKTNSNSHNDRTTPGYCARIQIRMVDEPAIKFISETLGGWYYRKNRVSLREDRYIAIKPAISPLNRY